MSLGAISAAVFALIVATRVFASDLARYFRFGDDKGAVSGFDFGLSMALFVVCLVEFLLLPGFAGSVFFLILTMVLPDVLAGFIVTIIASRRDFDLNPR